MKFFIPLTLWLLAASAIAATPVAVKPAATTAKTYTEKDFILKVNEEVKKKVDSIKNKSISDLTRELLDKEKDLNLRSLELDKERESLRASDQELGKKYADFEHKQKSFLGCVDKNEEESKARVGQLVEMVSSMKPAKAAEVLSVQESDIAVKIIQMIDAKKASKIFNFMDKEVSARLQKQYLLMKR